MLAALIIPPALWFAGVILWLWLPLPQPFPPAFGDVRNKVGAALTGVAGLVYLAFVLWTIVSILAEAGTYLDRILAPAGFAGKSHLLLGRRYTGPAGSREVIAEFMPGTSLQRPMLNVYAAASTSRRLSAGWETPLAGCAGCTRVLLNDARLRELTVLSDDPAWAARLLSSPPAADLLWQLLADPQSLGNRFVHVEAGRLWLQARPTAAGLEQTLAWITALSALATEAEHSMVAP